jgi:hypothetical protein
MVIDLPVSHRGWTEAERFEISLLRERFREPAFEIDYGATDHGDPWCVVHDTGTDTIIVHIARIGRRYHVVWPGRRRTEALTIAAAINLAVSG